jgi:hypothetical protein
MLPKHFKKLREILHKKVKQAEITLHKSEKSYDIFKDNSDKVLLHDIYFQKYCQFNIKLKIPVAMDELFEIIAVPSRPMLLFSFLVNIENVNQFL